MYDHWLMVHRVCWLGSTAKTCSLISEEAKWNWLGLGRCCKMWLERGIRTYNRRATWVKRILWRVRGGFYKFYAPLIGYRGLNKISPHGLKFLATFVIMMIAHSRIVTQGCLCFKTTLKIGHGQFQAPWSFLILAFRVEELTLSCVEIGSYFLYKSPSHPNALEEFRHPG